MTSRNVAAALDTAAGDMNAGQEHHDKPGLELVHSQHELVHSEHELVHLSASSTTTVTL